MDLAYYVLVPACGHLGRTEDAKTAIAKLQSLAPGVAISNFAPRMPFRDQRHLDILLDGLRKAGLPERPAVADHFAFWLVPSPCGKCLLVATKRSTRVSD